MVKIHKIKLLSHYWDDVRKFKKNAEVRYNDREYKVGDELILCEWNGQEFTGKSLKRCIGSVYPLDSIGLEGWVLICMY